MQIQRLICLGCPQMLLMLCAVPTHAAIPLAINHQGTVQVNGAPFTGTGLFRFAIVSSGAGNLWTNDGTEIGTAGTPVAAVSLSVENGLYSVGLGDTGLANMTALPSTVFDSPNVALRIWFDDGTNGNLQLSPDHLLTSVPYAFSSRHADTAAESVHSQSADMATTALDSVPSGLLVLGTTRAAPPAGFTSLGTRVQVPDSSWVSAKVMNTGVSSAASAVFDGKIHVFSGTTSSQLIPTHQAYNPQTDIWSILDPLPVARFNFQACAVSGKIYVMGGIEGPSGSVRNDIYDPVGNSWSTGADLPHGRSQFALSVLNGKIHAIGGFDPTGPAEIAFHDVYDPQMNTWSTAAPLPVAGADVGGPVVGGKIYAFLTDGRTFAYDPGMNTWSPKKEAPNPGRFLPFITTLNGLIYVMGGSFDAQKPLPFNDEYDPQTDNWSPQLPLPIPVFGAGGGVVGGKLHLFGGNIAANSVVDSHRAFTPPTSYFVLQKD